MKNLLLFVLLALAGVASAVTNTPTQTPTWTATPTFTPTLTYTETPIARRNPNLKRVYYHAAAFKKSDSITAPATTPTPGGVWMAQTHNQPYFVMGTGTAGSEPLAQLKLQIPVDYQKPAGVSGTSYPLTLWLEDAWLSTATNTAQICVNIYGVKQNADFSAAPRKYTFLGVTTNVQTNPNSYALAQVSSTARLVKLTMPLGVTQCAAGDDIAIEIVRSGTNGNLSIGGADVEYNPQNNWNP